MSEGRSLYIEEKIIRAIEALLAGRVNELLGEAEFPVPPVEPGGYRGSDVVLPVVVLSTCERTEKERLLWQDAYLVGVSLVFPDREEAELWGYACAAAFERALGENPALGGAASRAVLAGKKYGGGKRGCREAVFTVRVTVEGFYRGN